MRYKYPLIILILSSLIITISGLLIKIEKDITNTFINSTDIKTIFISVGTSLLASSLFAFFTIKKNSKEEKRSDLFEKMGLLNFYYKRDDITVRCTYLFEKAEIVDITAIRLKTLLEKHESTLTNLLKTKPIRIRILMPNPDSDSAKTIEELLGTKQSIRAGLKNVHEWQERLKKEQLKGTLEIRYSDKLISSMYQRIDNVVFTGPYMSKKESQGTFTIECDAFGDFGKILSTYFDTLFSEASISIKKRPFVVEFMGMPGAGKTTCVELLKNTHKEIYSHCNEDVECSPDDTPYTFNDRLIDSLSSKIQTVGGNGVLFLDRGIEDLKIWLKTHYQLKNLSKEEYRSLQQVIPKIPNNIKHYKILFIIPPNITKKRRIVRRRIDEWAIKDDTLKVLHNSYNRRKNSNDIIVIDSTLPLDEMKKKVLHEVAKIFDVENNRFN